MTFEQNLQAQTRSVARYFMVLGCVAGFLLGFIGTLLVQAALS